MGCCGLPLRQAAMNESKDTAPRASVIAGLARAAGMPALERPFLRDTALAGLGGFLAIAVLAGLGAIAATPLIIAPSGASSVASRAWLRSSRAFVAAVSIQSFAPSINTSAHSASQNGRPPPVPLESSSLSSTQSCETKNHGNSLLKTAKPALGEVNEGLWREQNQAPLLGASIESSVTPHQARLRSAPRSKSRYPLPVRARRVPVLASSLVTPSVQA